MKKNKKNTSRIKRSNNVLEYIVCATTVAFLGMFSATGLWVKEDNTAEHEAQPVKDTFISSAGNNGEQNNGTCAIAGDEVYVEYIDVGQGDSTLIYDKTSGFSCLIDTGLYEAYDNVQATIEEYGIEELNVLILTHPDTDHIQSAVDVLEDYNVPTLYMSKAVNDDAKAYLYLTEYLKKYDGNVVYAEAPETVYSTENMSLAIVGPLAYEDVTDTNGNSLVVRLENGNDSFLFLGDATGKEMDMLIASGTEMHADVLKASHHGSANDGCNSEYLIKNVEPEYMVVSCGYQNSHGHPHKETMELVQKYKISLYRTDLQGSIGCMSRGGGIIWGKELTGVFVNGSGFD